MSRRLALPVAMCAVGFVIGGFVGLAAAIITVVNASRPRDLFLWIVTPLFVAMVATTVFEGRLSQDMGFALDRPVAHQLGLALAVVLLVMVIVTPRADSDAEPEAVVES